MSNDTGFITLTASAAIAQNLRVKLSSGQAALAGAGEEAIGTSVTSAASGGKVTIKLDNAPGTHEVTASKAVAVDDICYSAASGKITDAASGSRQGIALTAAAADGSKFEMLPLDLAS